MLDALAYWLLAPVSNAPVVVFRWLFGALIAIFGVHKMRWELEYYCRDAFFIGFELTRFLRPLKRPYMRALLIAQAVAAVLLACGWLHPWPAIFVCGVRTYVYLLDCKASNNHDYLICLLLFLLCCTNAGELHMVERWEVLILQLQVLVVYFFGGLAKINHDWLRRAEPLTHAFAAKRIANARLRKILRAPQTAYAFSWGGMAFDLTIVFLLFDPRTQLFAIVPFVAFHVFNEWFFGLGIFPYLNGALMALFFTQRFNFVVDTPLAQPHVLPLLFFFCWMAVQILTPLRRYVLAYVTGRGRVFILADQNTHFSWTMKLTHMRLVHFRAELFERATGRTIAPLKLWPHYIPGIPTLYSVCYPRRLRFLLSLMDATIRAHPKVAGIDFGIRVNMWVSCNEANAVQVLDPNVDLRAQRLRIFGTYPWQNLRAPDARGPTNYRGELTTSDSRQASATSSPSPS